MILFDGEPDLGPWEVRPARAVAEDLIVAAGAHRVASRRTGPIVVAVDGRSGSGKSTQASLLAEHVPDAYVVHTDDIAWHHDFFDWAGLLTEGVLDPLARGEGVDYRPPGWISHGRMGSVVVPATAALVLVEGVGASRRSLMRGFDAAVWVQSDRAEARRRGVARDVELGRAADEAGPWWDGWEEREVPFLAEDRPWERADVVVCGTPVAAQVIPPPGGLLVSRSDPRS